MENTKRAECKPVADAKGDFLPTYTFQPQDLSGVCPCGCGRRKA